MRPQHNYAQQQHTTASHAHTSFSSDSRRSCSDMSCIARSSSSACPHIPTSSAQLSQPHTPTPQPRMLSPSSAHCDPSSIPNTRSSSCCTSDATPAVTACPRTMLSRPRPRAHDATRSLPAHIAHSHHHTSFTPLAQRAHTRTSSFTRAATAYTVS